MLSSDQNIENIGRLTTLLKRYIGLQKEYLKLDAIDKSVRLIQALVVVFVAVVIIGMIIIMLSIAAAFGLAHWVGTAWAFCVMAGLYLLFFVFFLIKRKKWIEQPLVNFLTQLFLS